jgi:hypothetical protein
MQVSCCLCVVVKKRKVQLSRGEVEIGSIACMSFAVFVHADVFKVLVDMIPKSQSHTTSCICMTLSQSSILGCRLWVTCYMCCSRYRLTLRQDFICPSHDNMLACISQARSKIIVLDRVDSVCVMAMAWQSNIDPWRSNNLIKCLAL